MKIAGAMVLVLVAIAICAGAADASADPTMGCDWCNYQGPNYDGSSPEKGLLREWPKDGPAVLWRAKIEQGWSCPSVSGNDVFVSMTSFKPGTNTADKESVVCLDARTGHEKWRHTDPTEYNNCTVGWGLGGIRSTPFVTDKCVYSIDPTGNIHCLDRGTGEPVWKKSLAPDYFYKPGMEHKGFTCSPIVCNNVLVIHGSTGIKEKHYVYVRGLDAKTGEEVWIDEDNELTEKTTAPGGTGQSPVLVTWNKEPCVVVTYNRYLRAIRVKDGKEVLKFLALPDHVLDNYPSPLVVNNNKVVVLPCTGFMFCDEIDFGGSTLQAKQAWQSPVMYGHTDYHNVVHHDGYLYGVTAYGTNANNLPASKLELVCLDMKSGKLAWKEPGFSHGYSQIVADGLLFVRSFQTLSLVDASPEGFKLKGRVEKIHNFEPRSVIDMRGLTDCVSPVLSRGCLYVRCPDELICFKVSDDKLRPASKPAAKVEKAPAAPPVVESKAEHLFKLAQESERSGQKDMAAQVYQQLVKQYPADVFAEKARAELKRLEAK
jgi:outer membrane protein assembly factor BamB